MSIGNKANKIYLIKQLKKKEAEEAKIKINHRQDSGKTTKKILSYHTSLNSVNPRHISIFPKIYFLWVLVH